MAINKPLQTLSDTEFRRWIERYWPDVNNISALGFGLPYLFGSGTDGDVVLSANTTWASHTIKQYKNLTLNATKSLTTTETSEAAIVIMVSERCSIAGTIDMSGKGGAGRVGSDGVPVAATDYATSYAGSGGNGGGNINDLRGGNGGSTIVTTEAASDGAHDGEDGQNLSKADLARFRMTNARDYAVGSYGGGGGGGRGNGVNSGGNGGGGGGVVIIMAKELTIESTGTITAAGINGGDAGGWCGGGGGGGGGLIYLVTQKLNNLGTTTAVGGNGGASDAWGHPGGDGGDGNVITEEIPT